MFLVKSKTHIQFWFATLSTTCNLPSWFHSQPNIFVYSYQQPFFILHQCPNNKCATPTLLLLLLLIMDTITCCLWPAVNQHQPTPTASSAPTHPSTTTSSIYDYPSSSSVLKNSFSACGNVKIKKKRFNFCDLEQGKPFFCS
jgi:hypothetical protein